MCSVNSSHFLLVPIGKSNIPLPNHCDITVWKCRIYKIDLQKILTIDYILHLDIIAFAILENGQSHFQLTLYDIFMTFCYIKGKSIWMKEYSLWLPYWNFSNLLHVIFIFFLKRVKKKILPTGRLTVNPLHRNRTTWKENLKSGNHS